MGPDQATALLLDASIRHSPQAELIDSSRDAPVWRTELPDGSPLWVATGYDAVKQVLTDPGLRTNLMGLSDTWQAHLANHEPPKVLGDRWQEHRAGYEAPRVVRLMSHMGTAEGAERMRLRKASAKWLAAVSLPDLDLLVTSIAMSLLKDLRPRGTADLVADYGMPLAVQVNCEGLGIPEELRPQLIKLGHWSPPALMEPQGSAVRQEYTEWGVEMLRIVEESIARRRVRPGNGLIDALLAAQEAGELAPHEVSSTVFLHLLAGFDTVAGHISAAMVSLWHRPDLLEELRAAPEIPPAAARELMRYAPGVASPMVRWFDEPLEVSGVRIPPHEPVLAHLAMANRDPSHFPNPNRLDFGRPIRQDATFSFGGHYCPGAAQGNAEGRIALGALLRELPGIVPRVDESAYQWRPGTTGSQITHLHVVAGLRELPVAWDA